MNAPFARDAEVFSEEIDPFLIANLYPRDTGLPMTVWIGPKAGARRDVRVKVSMSHGDRMDADNLATVSVRPVPEVLHGRLTGADAAAVIRWIELNREVIVDYWDGSASTLEMAQRLRPLLIGGAG